MNRTLLQNLLLGLSMTFLIMGCEPDNSTTVGEDWINNDTKVFYIDTFTVKTSTFKYDSIYISSPSRLLFGSYTDPVFGSIKATPYIQLYSEKFDIDSDAVYDSIALILDYNSYSYNDTLSVQKFDVYEVLETLKPEATYFYNTSTYTRSATSIGSISCYPTPKKSDSLHFTLDSSFGKTLFSTLQNNEINNLSELLDTYKGLTIEPSAENTAILSFNTTSKLRLFYSIKSEIESEVSYFDITLNAGKSFHNIATDYNNTYFKTLTEQQRYISSKTTDNLSYIQAGAGLATRIDIPYLEQINNITGSGSITGANLKFTLQSNTNTNNLTTRDSLEVYIIDQKSNELSQLIDYSGDYAYAIKGSNASEMDQDTYNINIKYFLDQKLEANNRDNLFLAIKPKGFTDSVDRYILEGENSDKSQYKTTLELYYALYDNE
ncbi:DUF4270 family protein [Formosa sp. S-31]|uniref:DUF4270 family protein n=1 Tax=Formosa sp. S-31 TaxID=2790949 RepID=UPI003EBBAA92